jgi:hypothetical protein
MACKLSVVDEETKLKPESNFANKKDVYWLRKDAYNVLTGLASE